MLSAAWQSDGAACDLVACLSCLEGKMVCMCVFASVSVQFAASTILLGFWMQSACGLVVLQPLVQASTNELVFNMVCVCLGAHGGEEQRGMVG